MPYIGQPFGQGQADRYRYTAVGGETLITQDDVPRAFAYTPGQVDIYLNGVKQVIPDDVIASTGTNIIFLVPLTVGDIVELIALDNFQAADHYLKSQAEALWPRRNYLVNGNFKIWQRTTSIVDPTTGIVAADHWICRGTANVGATTMTISQEMDDTTNQSSMKVETTSATSTFYMLNRIEGKFLFGEQVVVSFQVKPDSNCEVQVSLTSRENDVDINAPAALTTACSAGQWTNVEAVFTAPLGTSAAPTTLDSLQLNITLTGVAAGALGTNAIRVRDVQVEKGDKPTSFEHRSLSEELRLCQRYFWRIQPSSIIGTGSIIANGSQLRVPVQFPVFMAFSPSVAMTGFARINSTAGDYATMSNVYQQREDGVNLIFTSPVGFTYTAFNAHSVDTQTNNGSATNYIDFTAEI